MNKLITTALLLVAGAALTQAASVVYSFGANTVTGMSAFSTSCAGSNNASATAVSLGDAFGSATVTISTTAGNNYDVTVSPLGGSYSNSDALSALSSATGLGTTAIQSISSNMNGGAGGNTMTVTFYGLSANTEYQISAILTAQSTTGEFAVTTGTIVSGGYGSLTGTGWTNANNAATLAVSNAIAVVYTVTSDENGAIAFTATQKSAISLLGISTVAVPEPSAFGLLAGVGALALVASRRRRARKAA